MEKGSSNLEAIYSIILVTTVFSIYLLVTGLRSIRRWISSGANEPAASVRITLFNKLTGFILFGFIPLFFIRLTPEKNPVDYGISVSMIIKSLLIALPFALIIIPLSYLNSGKSDNLKQYPMFRLPFWHWNSLIISALSWIMYLAAYEFMFRGFLLFSCIQSFSIPVAILINICLYSLAHIPKGLKETIGSIPAGLIFCLLVIKLGSIWVALFIHIIMALSNEWFSIAAHPEMEFRLRKTRVR
jgi:membrane protease YdiL (CAAX protease family)